MLRIETEENYNVEEDDDEKDEHAAEDEVKDDEVEGTFAGKVPEPRTWPHTLCEFL